MGRDLVDDGHAADDFAEDGVFAVEEGGAAVGGVGLDLFGGEGLAEAHGEHVELVVVIDGAVNDVELASGGGLLGVDVVAHAGCGHGAALVDVGGHERWPGFAVLESGSPPWIMKPLMMRWKSTPS